MAMTMPKGAICGCLGVIAVQRTGRPPLMGSAGADSALRGRFQES
jgi:hypothetical protein